MSYKFTKEIESHRSLINLLKKLQIYSRKYKSTLVKLLQKKQVINDIDLLHQM